MYKAPAGQVTWQSEAGEFETPLITAPVDFSASASCILHGLPDQ
jgi:hypothetical protein